MDYPLIPKTSPVSHFVAPFTPQDPLPSGLVAPAFPSPGSKNIFAFWHTGLTNLPPYLVRNVLAWYRRFSPLSWNIYVLDNVPGSPLNVSNYIETQNPDVVPCAFTNGTLNGRYAAQHTSDLIRYPLLLKYGGVYLDVGILQFGDLDWLWTNKIANPDSPYDFAGFTMGEPPEISIVNFALMCRAGNPLVERAHKILLSLWEDKTNTAGMHSHPLVAHIPLMKVPEDVVVDAEGRGKMAINDASMTDYAIQIQAMGSAQSWSDEEEGWDGPKYVREKAWLYSMMTGAMVAEQLGNWSGKRQLDLLSQKLPRAGEEETEDQRLAREIVEKVVGESWCMKLGHGFSAELFGGDTLGLLWRKNDGSDCQEGTYAGWMRWAEANCQQNEPPKPMKVPLYEPTMRARLADYL